MRMLNRVVGVFALLLLPCIAWAQNASRPPEPMSSAELQLELQRLNTLGSALYLAAHPDDENTAMLAWLHAERKLRTAYLSITRGDGGQNLIGDEKGDLLGVIRTQELLAARSIDGATQFFTRAIDFGYSKSPEETLSVWDEQALLHDVVWVIRKFRPDVIITRFPTDGQGGHGQHTASAILAVKAFSMAGDPAAFPDQLHLVEPWQPKRVFWNSWQPQRDPDADLSSLLKVDLGSYNELLGKSYTEIAGESRSMHKSQGFGAAERRGTTLNYLSLLAGDPATADPFDGIAMDWSRLPGSAKVATALLQAEQEFQPENRAAVLPILLRAWTELQKMPDSFWVREKKSQLKRVIQASAGLWLEAIAERPAATPGSTVKVTVTAINRSDSPFLLESVSLTNAAMQQSNAPLANNQPVEVPFSLAIPPNAPVSQPYWLQGKSSVGMYAVDDLGVLGRPESPAPFTAKLVIRAGAERIEYEVPLLYRWVDRVEGELYRSFSVVPPLTVTIDEPVYLFPEGKSRTIKVTARAGMDGLTTTLTPRVPQGWKVSPSSFDVIIAREGGQQILELTVDPPATASSGEVTFALADGSSARSWQELDYRHIPTQLVFSSAEARLVRADLKKSGETIGYLVGSGDEIPEGLAQLGYRVDLISDADLDRLDLSRYDAIIAGVRAFNTRPDLARKLDRIFQYVEDGGTFLVQYNTADRTLPETIAPYPLTLGRDRVAVEEAPVQILQPTHPVMLTPNRITPADFDGWVQERGLYFAQKWAPQYEPLLSSHDPGEEPKTGGLLIAPHGKGRYIYSGYSFFRQLPAGVPGAWKLFLNLIANEE